MPVSAEDGAVKFFYSAKALCPIVLCAIAAISGIGSSSPIFIYIACIGIGFLIPDFALGKLISNRQAKIRRGLPDVLDMLVICVEAGLSLDQATARTAEELHRAQPVLSDELGIVALEQRAGSARSDAWKHLGGTHRSGFGAQSCLHAGPVGAVWNEHCKDTASTFRHAEDQACPGD